MSASCRHAGCPLQAEPSTTAEGLCVLHSPREGKSRSEVVPALAELHEAGVIRVQNLQLRGADLSGVTLTLKNLQHSDLTGANLHNARLEKVGFDFSRLDGANFEGAILEKVDLRRVTSLHRCFWFETIFDAVQVPAIEHVGLLTPYDDGLPEANPTRARFVFRHFKELYKGVGDYDSAGLFYEREMDTKRHAGPRAERVWWWLLWVTCGYGERPVRTVCLFFGIIVAFALGYMQCDVRGPDGPVRDLGTALYFSTITFTSAGYGDVLPVSNAARALAGSEALIGVFMISLFVFVFCRRMER